MNSSLVTYSGDTRLRGTDYPDKVLEQRTYIFTTARVHTTIDYVHYLNSPFKFAGRR